MVSDPFRPPRRRRLLWPIIILVGAVVALAVALSNQAEESPSLYAEDLRGQAAMVNRKAGTFQELLGRMSSVDRVELTEVIDDLDRALSEARDFLAQGAPPAAAGAAAVFDLSLQLWSEGVVLFRDSLLATADDTSTGDAEDRLLNALLSLRAGDRLYTKFVTALEASELTQPVTPMPVVTFLPESYPLSAAARTLVAIASSDQSLLEQRASIRIQQVSTVPEWVLDTEGNLVVEQTETLVTKVIVANPGNVKTDPGTVLALLTSADGGIQRVEAPFPELAAGKETTVVLPELAVASGGTYQLVVRLPAFEIDSPASFDSKTFQFKVNEPTPTTDVSTTTSGG